MAPKKKDKGPGRDYYQTVLGQFGVGGSWQWLIHQAVTEQWSAFEFENALIQSKPFQRLYPGLVDRSGGINPFLGDSLAQATANYRSLVDQYDTIQKNFPGLPGGRERFGMLIANDVSPDEYARRMQALYTVKKNPGLKDAFNQELRAAGLKPLDDIGWFKFMAGSSSRRVYDIYEAAHLRSSLGLKPTEALRTARVLGTSGTPADLGTIVSKVRQILPDIGPELAARGITTADLSILASGNDPKGLAPLLQQIMDNRRAEGTPVGGVQPRKGPGGGLATSAYETETY